jgi:tRNA C32,U32 (ribose-2'-O)-methylase TrmJ
MMNALEGGLARIEFFKARSSEGVMRIFRTLLARAELDAHEAGLVKALGFEISNYMERREGPPRRPEED